MIGFLIFIFFLALFLLDNTICWDVDKRWGIKVRVGAFMRPQGRIARHRRAAPKRKSPRPQPPYSQQAHLKPIILNNLKIFAKSFAIFLRIYYSIFDNNFRK